MKKRILFVDDSTSVLQSIASMLRDKQPLWDMTFTNDPQEAWKSLLETSFDAVVSDVNMPLLSGLELLDRMKNADRTRDIPVVMLAGLGDRDLKRQALERGAADFLSKPVESEDLVARIQNVLNLKDYEDQLKDRSQGIERKVRERTAELNHSRMELIWRLGKIAEHRDSETGDHIIRVGCMSRAVATKLGMDREFIETLFVASPLHDIGKVGISDAILLKQGPLSETEWQMMMQHCRFGEQILRDASQAERYILQDTGKLALSRPSRVKNPLLEMAATIALTHHEKWDGSGYPQGMAGEMIPIESRITAMADVFDALTSRRPYKPAFEVEKALAIVRESVGSHFDPRVHRAFEEALPQLLEIRAQYGDHSSTPECEALSHASDSLCQ